MIHPCLDLIRTELNAHIKVRAGIEEDRIVLQILGAECYGRGTASK